MTSRPRIVRSSYDPADPETMLWPITLVLLLLGGFIGGAIYHHSDFQSPHLVYNGWAQLATLTLSVAALIAAAALLRGKVLMRVQFGVLVSLILHLLLLFTLQRLYLEKGDDPVADGDAMQQAEVPPLPDYGVPFSDAPLPEEAHEQLVETKITEVLPDSKPHPLLPQEVKVRPNEQLKAPDSTVPQQVDLKRAEVSAPRQGEMAGKSVSRQEIPKPDSALEEAPELEKHAAPAPRVEEADDPTPQPAAAAPRRTAEAPKPDAPEVETADGPPPTLRQRAESASPATEQPADAALAASAPREVQAASTPTGGAPQAPETARRPAVQPNAEPVLEAAETPRAARSTQVAAASAALAEPSPAPPSRRTPERAEAADDAMPSAPAASLSPARSMAETQENPSPEAPSRVASRPSEQPSDTPEAAPAERSTERSMAAARPNPNQPTLEDPSEATTTAPEAVRAERRSTPDAASTAAAPAPRARSAGEMLPTTSADPERVAANVSAESAAQPEPESAQPESVRRSPGAGGQSASRNFSQEAPNASSPSAQASAAMTRAQSSRVDAASNDPSPSQTSRSPRSAAGAEATASALSPQRAVAADRTAGRTSENLESTSSAARRSAASQAAPGPIQASAGSAAADLAENRPTAPSAGLSRGAASQGSGEPHLAANPQPARRGRAARAGEAKEGAPDAPAAITATRGSDASRIAGPEVDSRSAASTRRSPTNTPAGGSAAAARADLAGAGASSGAASRATAVERGGPAGKNSSGPAGIGPPEALGKTSARNIAAAEGTSPAPVAAASRGTVGGGMTSATDPGAALEAAASKGPRVARTPGGSIVNPQGTDPAQLPGATKDGSPEAAGMVRRELAADLESGPTADASGQGRNRTAPDGPAAGESPTLVASRPVEGKGSVPRAAGESAELEAANQVRRARGGPQVNIVAKAGEGGLAENPNERIGIPERRAQRESEQVSMQSARFILEKSLGRPLTRGEAENVTPPTYMLRRPDARQKVAQQFGGSPESEKAVELGLDFLARQQHEDGRWTLHGYRDEPASDKSFVRENHKDSDAAATGLALLAFLGAGYDHRDGKYKQTVSAGLDWLVRHQRPNGDLYTGGNDQTNRYYTHGIGSIALCEALAMTRDPQLRGPVDKAIQFILQSQDPVYGGWRYRPGYERKFQSDTSVTGWQVMALRSAEFSGTKIPPETYQKVHKWLDFAEGPGKNPARYAYLPYELSKADHPDWMETTPVMTAEALLMRMYLGWDRNSPAMRNGADYLVQNLPPTSLFRGGTQRDCYYWYYATQVMYHVQGDGWTVWNERLRNLLVDTQDLDGPLAGSWNPNGDKWGSQGGRIYVTTLHLLMLEVYYRHLPLYRVHEGPALGAP